MRRLTICIFVLLAAASAARADRLTEPEETYVLELSAIGLGDAEDIHARSWTSPAGGGRTLGLRVADVTLTRTVFPSAEEVEAFIKPYTLRCEQVPFFLERRGRQVVLLQGERLGDPHVLNALRTQAWETLPHVAEPTRIVADQRVGMTDPEVSVEGLPERPATPSSVALDTLEPGAAGVLEGLVPGAEAEVVAPPPVFDGTELAEVGRKQLLGRTWGHKNAVKKTGVGHYYGTKSSYDGLSAEGKAAWIADNATGKVKRKPTRSSCIGWALTNLRATYRKQGLSDRWSEHVKFIMANKSRGTDVAKRLQMDGWVTVYFNPDVNKPADGSSEHPLTARRVRQQGTYYGIPVDHQVINYRPAPGSGTAKNRSGLAKLTKVRYWFGLARGGTHTFMGTGATVHEFHWTSNPDDPDAVEAIPLVKYEWLSGLIVVPPGTWPE